MRQYRYRDVPVAKHTTADSVGVVGSRPSRLHDSDCGYRTKLKATNAVAAAAGNSINHLRPLPRVCAPTISDSIDQRASAVARYLNRSIALKDLGEAQRHQHVTRRVPPSTARQIHRASQGRKRNRIRDKRHDSHAARIHVAYSFT